ncbi:hypothetical protein MTR67_017222 [Solanum verrucosum]|uniref:Peptidase M16 N-terminal domain-containing protein n=1 Tax=Solanum verrucosum TaxID=315347 RepID=A0AAF0QJB9_SOLVR|nr:hypothetical protein MTR67_017222 [Solanum verrucosum]
MAVGKANEPVEIFKARSDKREYRRIVLQNSLEVLLISDPETDKCAASMEVSVGYYSDPKGLEGLAHFLEHMLFYASEKYPVENSYSKYITQIYYIPIQCFGRREEAKSDEGPFIEVRSDVLAFLK